MHPYVNIAITAARQAGKIITRHYEQLDEASISEKGLNDLVTKVDKAAEESIIETIKKNYPDHSILAEESGKHSGNDYTWIIDPLDGTMNYVHGFPQFAVSIGIKFKDQMEHAVIYDPLSQDLYTATRGSGAQINNRRIRVSKKENFRNALIGAYSDYYLEDLKRMHLNVTDIISEQGADTRKNGSAALNLAYVACGRLDGFWESGIKPWDIAAGILLVREAGGFVSDFDGENDYFSKENIIAGTRKIHEGLLNIIQAEKSR